MDVNSRVGETKINTYGSNMIIEKYNDSSNIWVRFPETNILLHAEYVQFKRGTLKSPYDKTVYGIGYLGEGNAKVSENRIHTKQYNTWKGIIQRCYIKKFHEKNPTYIGCSVVEEWLNFNTFSKWYDDNYYEIDKQKMALDKDILVKGNKIYSPETCVFVPSKINNLFTKRESSRGEFPLGVSWNKSYKKYKATCRNKNDHDILGYYNTPEDAFLAYKIYKEKLIKQTAEDYKDNIPDNLYCAMLNYKVEIND